MEWMAGLFRGKDRFCMRRNLPGFPAFGTMDSGEVWKGPIFSSTSVREKGPAYRLLLNSRVMISSKAVGREWVDGSFGGIYVYTIFGIPAFAPCCMYQGRFGYLARRSCLARSRDHPSCHRGVVTSRLCEQAVLGAMTCTSATRTFVAVPCAGTSDGTLPVRTNDIVLAVDDA